MFGRRYSLWTFLFFLILVHVFYYRTWDAGFVTDFTGLMARMEGQSIAGVLDCFGFPALEQLLNLFLFLFVKTFGTAPLPWYLVFTTMHALNSWLLFRLGERLLQRYKVPSALLVALGGSLVFLLSPYSSEVLVWRVCFNFLFSTFLILSVLWMAVRWLETQQRKHLLAAHGLFILALFTFELSLTVPVIGLILTLFWWGVERQPRLALAWSRLNLPQWILTFFYFGLNKLVLGSWVGHYGVEVHLKMVWTDIFGNAFKYLTKYLAFVRYWPHPRKEGLFNALSQPEWLLPLVGISLLLLLLAVWQFKRLTPRMRLAGLFLLLALAALIPVINLYFNYLLYIENDRYGYLFSAFFGLFLVTLLSTLPRPVFYILLVAYLSVSGWFLYRTISFWAQSTQVYRALLDSFPEEGEEIYLLTLPDNLNGALLFRDYSGSDAALADALKYVKEKPFPGRIREVVKYNMTDTDDGVTVERDSTGVFIVTFEQWGNWWWRRGIGAGSYETDDYRFINQGHSYRLEMKDTLFRSRILFQSGKEWKTFDVDFQQTE